MRSFFSILGLAGILAFSGCGSSKSSGTPTPPTDTGVETAPKSDDVAFESWDAGLYGEDNGAVITALRPSIYKAVGDSNADVICLNSIWRQKDKDAILAATKAKFPYSFYRPMNWDTLIDDSTDADGKVVPPRTTPPCSTDDDKAKAEIMLDCLVKNCSTIPGSADGHYSDTATPGGQCFTLKCSGEGLELFVNHPRCANCGKMMLESSSFNDFRAACYKIPGAEFGFNGQGGNVLLSKYPIKASEEVVIPGMRFRRSVIRSTVTVPSGADVDVYCTAFNFIADSFSDPYTGDYGKGKTDVEGWVNEQQLQAKKLIDMVNKKTPTGRAFIMGDFRASKDVLEGSTVLVVGNKGSKTLDMLLGAFTEALVPGYKPACTLCPDINPDTKAADPLWFTHLFMKGIPATSVKSTERTYTERTATFPTGEKVPPSYRYGMKSVVSVPK